MYAWNSKEGDIAMKVPWTTIQILTISALLACGCDRTSETDGRSTSTQPDQTILVEVSCGECQFGLPGTGCDLAVRIDGTAYYVDGSAIDDHGDAHAEDGLCNAIRQGRVVGRVEKGRFVATSVEVLPTQSK